MPGHPPNRLFDSPPDWSKLDDDVLVQILDAWEEHVPLKAAEECLKRIDRLGGRFSDLCRDPESWKRFECGSWSVLHAWLVLAQSGRDEFATALFEGTRHFILSSLYHQFWGSSDHTLASFPPLFLDILGEAASDPRQDRSLQGCAAIALGVAMLARPDGRQKRTDDLIRIVRNPRLDDCARGYALNYLAETGNEQLLESLVEEPVPEGFDRDYIEEKFRYRQSVDQEAPQMLAAFEFYSETELEHRRRMVRSHREFLSLEVSTSITVRLDAKRSAQIAQFEGTLASLSPLARAGCLLAGRWFLAREQVADDPLQRWKASHLEWFLFRIVRYRCHVEGSAEVDFWEAVERFLQFVASRRKVPDARARKWQDTIATLRLRTGERAGF